MRGFMKNARGATVTSLFLLLLASGLTLSPGCSSDDDGGTVIDTVLTATFVPSDATPDPQSVTLQPAGESGAVFSVVVRVTDVADFFGAAFHVTFDTSKVRFTTLDTTTSFLRDGGIDPANLNFTFVNQTGELVLTATRVQDPGGTIPGIDVPASGRDLLRLNFIAVAATGSTSSGISFADPRQVCDSTQPVCVPIAVTWSGGSVLAN
jgi:hypothetical protein